MNLLSRARARARAVRTGTESGFMLIYVLVIGTLMTIMVETTVVVTTNAIAPTVQSAYSQAADAAAQGGLQAFIAYADANCSAAFASVATCSIPNNATASGAIPLDGTASSSYSATWIWTAVKDPSNRYYRVQSTGTVKLGSLTSTKVVIADVVGGSSLNLLDYGIVTGFESQSSATVLAQWPRRTIALDATAIDAASVPIKGSDITWSGASAGTAAGKVAICNATFDAKGGRSNNLPKNAPTPYVDWTESGLSGNNYTNYEPCQTSWGTLTKLIAPANPANGPGGYYSNDALLLSNSYPGGTGPLYNQPVSTNWQYTSADAGICGTAPGQNYRSYFLTCAGYPLELGGSPSPASAYPNVQYGQGPQIPTGQPTLPASTTCIYNGPTRVAFSGDTATITSPQTTPTFASSSGSPAQCYPGADGATGMSAATVNLASPTVIRAIAANTDGTAPNTTPAIAHGSSGWPTTGQVLGTAASTSNSVFYMTNGSNGTTTTTAYSATATDGGYTPAVGDNPSTKTDGAWTPQWPSYSNGGCPVTSAIDLKFLNCNVTYSPSSNAYSWVKAGVSAALAANPGSYTTAAALQTLINSFVSQGNSSDAANSTPTNANSTSHRWQVSVAQGNAGTCTQSTGVAGTVTDTPVSAPSSDPFYTNTNGNSHAVPSTNTSCFTATVTEQIGQSVNGLLKSWGDGGLLGLGLVAGSTIPQFKVTVTAKTTTTVTTTTQATSTFPSMSDVTQYQMGNSGTFGASGPGDLYVEGNAGHTLALVAQNDVIVTNNLATTDSSSYAVEVVAQNDVRVYHPVSCLITNAAMIADTSPGFCPDDITGLYSTVLAPANRPDQQYVNMRTDLAGLTIKGAVFALGNAPAHITCPQPPNGGGVCGGEFTTDNFSRGSALGQITVIGSLAMAHHAPVGQEWDVADSSGQTSRPYSGYQLAEQYQNLKAIFAGVGDVNSILSITSSTSDHWHILSVSNAKP